VQAFGLEDAGDERPFGLAVRCRSSGRLRGVPDLPGVVLSHEGGCFAEGVAEGQSFLPEGAPWLGEVQVVGVGFPSGVAWFVEQVGFWSVRPVLVVDGLESLDGVAGLVEIGDPAIMSITGFADMPGMAVEPTCLTSAVNHGARTRRRISRSALKWSRHAGS